MTRITIRHVAERAGVSRQTVSRAINDRPGIDPETRKRVLAVAREMGYRPSNLARGLKTNRTSTIGLVVPDIANPFFAEVARGASEVAYAGAYSVLLCNTEEEPDREWDTLQMLEDHRVDGLLLISSRLDSERLLRATEIYAPVVLVNRQVQPRPGVGCVLADDEGAAEIAVAHLIERGHRCIGMLGGSPGSHSGRERRRGYYLGMQNAGLECPERWYAPCTPTVEGGRLAAYDLLRANPELTALLAYNDLVAVGTLQACAALGSRVPERCAIVGWDDIVFASYVSPPLTTMRMPKYRIGEEAMSLLFALIREPGQTPEPVVLEAELVVRGTT